MTPSRPSYADRARPRRPTTPLRSVVFWFAVVACAGICVLATVVAVVTHDKSARSQRVQRHGIRVEGHVVGLTSTSMNSADYRLVETTATITVLPPVDHIVVSRVHLAGASGVRNGDTLAALVDPRDHDYAELPGRSTEDPVTWWGASAFAASTLAVTVYLLVGGVRRSRRALPAIAPTDKRALRNRRKRVPPVA